MQDLIFIFAILAAARGLLAGVRWAHSRYSLSPETGRKVLHAGMGIILVPLPWVFESVGPVVLLTGVFVGLLVARRFVPALDRQVADVIYGVGRRSAGEFYFPVTVLALFAMTGPGDKAGFVGPVLVLALADAAAALVGRRWGLCTYPAPGGGRKSIEGSLALCAVALACVLGVELGLGGGGPVGRMVLTAAAVAIAVTLVEAACPCGLDNVVVPLAVLGMMRLLGSASAETVALTAGAAAGVALVLVTAWAIAGEREELRTAVADSAE
ncbi:MAG TPA: hypothetical protein VK986_25590 [Tepidisphaeraceae bacterium]|nr:hypothetical protein [Tepidisphaeraceae bacterium]